MLSRPWEGYTNVHGQEIDAAQRHPHKLRLSARSMTTDVSRIDGLGGRAGGRCAARTTVGSRASAGDGVRRPSTAHEATGSVRVDIRRLASTFGGAAGRWVHPPSEPREKEGGCLKGQEV